MNKVTVHLTGNNYEIHIGAGLLEQTGDRLRELGFHDKAVIITDTIVKKLYGGKIENSLTGAGFKVTLLTVQPGEEYKSLETAGRLYTQLGDALADRTTPVLAMGGGVIGDMAGFVAATYMRGLPLVQIPTTLLAQVDSSIGGKVAVDHGALKNMIGTFYQPKLTLADISLVRSLDRHRLSDGLAEVIKHAVILDRDLFDYFEKNIEKVLRLDEERLEHIVYRSAQIKAGIVEQDERDTGRRNILNFGHTVGHALESVSNFAIGHGAAVSIGMTVAGRLSQKMGYISQDDLKRIVTLLNQAGLPTDLPNLKVEDIIQTIKHDKKVARGKLRYVLIDSIGQAAITEEITLELIVEVLNRWNEKS